MVATILLTAFGSLFFFLVIYERGQRKGIEQTEQMFEPIINKLFERFDQKELLKEVRNLAVAAALKKPIPQDWRATIAKVDTLLGTDEYDESQSL